MKRLFPMLILILALACQENSPLEKKISIPEQFFQSSSFKELGIGLGRLNLEKFDQNSRGEETFVIFPIIGNDLQYVFGYGLIRNDGQVEFKRAYLASYITEMNYDQVSKSIQDSTYTGTIRIQKNIDHVIEGKYMNGKLIKLNSSRTSWCGDLERALHCAAWRIHDMGWAERYWCYFRMPECLIETMLFCMLEESCA